jgi:hypothetical protein
MPDDDAAYLASLAERGHATCCASPCPADGGCRADLLFADFVEEAGLAWSQQHATRYRAPSTPSTPAPSTKAQAGQGAWLSFRAAAKYARVGIAALKAAQAAEALIVKTTSPRRAKISRASLDRWLQTADRPKQPAAVFVDMVGPAIDRPFS